MHSIEPLVPVRIKFGFYPQVVADPTLGIGKSFDNLRFSIYERRHGSRRLGWCIWLGISLLTASQTRRQDQQKARRATEDKIVGRTLNFSDEVQSRHA
jgi:hypothetical protein